MNDPNRRRDAGDPNTGAARPPIDWNESTPPNDAANADAEDGASTAWTGSNPGTTGDTPTDTGTTAEAGSGVEDAGDRSPLGRTED